MFIDTRESFPPVLAAELIDPITGEILDRQDADQLIESYQRIDRHQRDLYELRRQICFALAALTEGDARTRRLRGKTRQCKIEMPGPCESQPLLKQAWNAYPKLRDEFMKISSIGIRWREWNKIKNTSGPPDFEQLKKMISGAILPATGTPRISLDDTIGTKGSHVYEGDAGTESAEVGA